MNIPTRVMAKQKNIEWFSYFFHITPRKMIFFRITNCDYYRGMCQVPRAGQNKTGQEERRPAQYKT